MFSYFLMKGMEGEAGANQDNQITAGELHVYVEQNVVQQSCGALNKWLQENFSKQYVIHGFRHSLRDRLRAVECPSDVVDDGAYG